jgi:mercuric ion binding protein
MKHLLLVAAVLFLLAGISAAQSRTATVLISTRIHCDHCKACPTCGEYLEQAVYALKGIKRVDLDEKSMTIQVVYNPLKTAPDQIRKAIARAGYDADEVKADPAAYAQLDDCCKKQ